MSQLFKLVQSDKLRIELDEQQQKRISSFYQQMAKDIRSQSKKLKGRTNISSILRMQYLKQMEKELKTAFVESEKKIGNEIKSNMEKISKAVVKDNDAWMKSLGMPNGGALLNVPKDIIEKVITGKLYEGDWTLSKALWQDVKKKQSDINEVIAKGIAQNKSAYDIAKDLEQYVNPKARKDWKWSKVYPGTNKVIDYNAQRLARTMVSHAYQQSLVDTTKNNPFVQGLEWRATGGERMCPICADRDGTVYKKGDLPLDHPNGMCTFIAVIEDDNIMIDRLSNWVKGGDDKELDVWSKTLGNKPSKTKEEVKPKDGFSLDKQLKRKGHIPNAFDKEKLLSELTGASLEQVKLMQYSLERFTGNGFTRMIQYQTTGVSTFGDEVELVNNLSKFLELSPKWDNSSSLYRGMKFSKFNRLESNAGKNLLNSLKEGSEFTQNAHRSFSSELDRAKSFAKANDEDYMSILLEVKQTNRAVPISHFSRFDNEKEVLMPADTKFKVLKVTKSANEYNILLEELS